MCAHPPAIVITSCLLVCGEQPLHNTPFDDNQIAHQVKRMNLQTKRLLSHMLFQTLFIFFFLRNAIFDTLGPGLSENSWSGVRVTHFAALTLHKRIRWWYENSLSSSK